MERVAALEAENMRLQIRLNKETTGLKNQQATNDAKFIKGSTLDVDESFLEITSLNSIIQAQTSINSKQVRRSTRNKKSLLKCRKIMIIHRVQIL